MMLRTRQNNGGPASPRHGRIFDVRAGVCSAMAAGFAAYLALSGMVAAAEFDASAASVEELFFHMQRYGTTQAKRERKEAARTEFFTRGADALSYLIDHSDIENLWINVFAFEMVRTLPAEEAVPVLLRGLASDKPRIRKFAAFFLGFHDVPEHAPKLVPLLDHEKTRGAAIRTLGKWKCALPQVIESLNDEKERRRILAVNALGDIGDPQAIPALIQALGDPYFTVRKTAARALAVIGRPAERPLLRALPTAERSTQRGIIAALGGMKSRKAIRTLRRMLKDPDTVLAEDAARALLAIDPGRAEKWLAKAGIEPELLALEEE